jgi:hypothetical protein
MEGESMATDVLVWTGSGWESIRGPQGPEGPTAVSADAVNVAKLGSDGKILVRQSELDDRYVLVTGDTMTGPLAIRHTGSMILDVASTSQAQTVSRVSHYSDAATGPRLDLMKRRGTEGAPLPVQNGDSLGAIHWRVHSSSGAERVQARINATALGPPTAAGLDCMSEWVVIAPDGVKPSATVGIENKDATGRKVYLLTDRATIDGNLGVGWSTPTVKLEVGGATILRSTLEVVGNITSAGTSHSFAAGSIPSSAVVGNVAFTPGTSGAAGAVGAMRWDENYLYVRTATAWKRIPLQAF